MGKGRYRMFDWAYSWFTVLRLYRLMRTKRHGAGAPTRREAFRLACTSRYGTYFQHWKPMTAPYGLR